MYARRLKLESLSYLIAGPWGLVTERSNRNETMTFLADLLNTVFERRFREPDQIHDDDRPIESLAEDLVSATGDHSGLSLARAILSRYQSFDDDRKLQFLRHLATEMNIDPEAVRNSLDEYEKDASKNTYRAFMVSVEPRRQELIRRLNRVPGATQSLVRLRADLRRLGQNEPELEALDIDFRHLLASWFNRGFLVLRPITWESPAHILEKIIAYEAVHAINSWDELRRRLEPKDRRCFAFFHPAMADEPLIFVEVALTKGIPDSIQYLLSEDRNELRAEEANTAVFYSISNCQAGLAGISFGNSLIKQVVSDLSAELPGLKSFVTLSPIPDLRRWLDEQGFDYALDNPEEMRKMAASYLLLAKGRRDLPFDPVARFHLENGAIIHKVHAEADTSVKGMEQSGGVMVNYLYDLSKVADNHEAFATKKKVIASGAVKSLSDPKLFS